MWRALPVNVEFGPANVCGRHSLSLLKELSNYLGTNLNWTGYHSRTECISTGNTTRKLVSIYA